MCDVCKKKLSTLDPFSRWLRRERAPEDQSTVTGGDDGIRAIARTGGVRPRARWTARDFIANYLCKNELRICSEAISTILT